MKIRELIEPLLVYADDALSAATLLEDTDGQFARRAYIRSTMAVIEGTIWLLKQTCLKANHPSKPKRIPVAVFAILCDETYDLKNNGEVRTSTKYLKLPDNVRFTIDTCNQLFGCNLDLQVGHAPWDRFLTAVKIRNRIMHPKVIADFEVSDQEISDFKDVIGWFNDLIHEFVVQLTNNAADLDVEGDTSGAPC